ncbi:GNAT family N-acetyltransferase [Aeromicrobium sp.]|uniref:GNAT family N-acetyltransferase n=1 Tax=Aeromicrobium sp. TaxID=1871063 RepID=UPI003512E20F
MSPAGGPRVRPDGAHVAGVDDLDARTLHDLLRLRVEVFVVEQACPYPEVDGRDVEPGTRHLWLLDGDAVAATLRILEDDDGLARIGRVATAAAARGRGLAGTLMEAALDEIGERASVLDAQAHLSSFYERFGFLIVGAQYLEDGIPHVPMLRTPVGIG